MSGLDVEGWKDGFDELGTYQVGWSINVGDLVRPLDSQVVAEQLERNNVDDGLDVLGDEWDREQDGVGASDLRDLRVILAANDDEIGTSSAQLLYDGYHLAVERVGRGDDDDGHVLINQCQRAVLHLSGEDALAVHQGDFLHLESPLNGGGVV